jgi:hypothetical protein
MMAHPAIEKARELLSGRRQQETEHEAWRTEHAEQLFNAKIDALLSAPIKNRAADADGLIYRTNENARVIEQQPVPTTFMSPENAEGWNRWLDSHLTKFNNEIVIQHFDDYHEHVVKEFDLVVKELRDEIKALRAELHDEITRAISKSANRLIIFDSSDPQARKEIKDNPDKILDWSEMRRKSA